jgi:hypothetical protein
MAFSFFPFTFFFFWLVDCFDRFLSG